MKRILWLIAFILLNSNTWAQDDSLFGKWQLKEIWLDSILVFDSDNIDISYQYSMANKVKYGKMKTKADSTNMIDFIKDFHAKSKLAFYEFNKSHHFKPEEKKHGGQYVLPEDLFFGNVRAGSLIQSGDTLKVIEKRGGFETDGYKILITLEGTGSDYGCCNFEIKGDLLILKRFSGLNITTVYRKTKE
jgi:hypothetical protein